MEIWNYFIFIVAKIVLQFSTIFLSHSTVKWSLFSYFPLPLHLPAILADSGCLFFLSTKSPIIQSDHRFLRRLIALLPFGDLSLNILIVLSSVILSICWFHSIFMFLVHGWMFFKYFSNFLASIFISKRIDCYLSKNFQFPVIFLFWSYLPLFLQKVYVIIGLIVVLYILVWVSVVRRLFLHIIKTSCDPFALFICGRTSSAHLWLHNLISI